MKTTAHLILPLLLGSVVLLFGCSSNPTEPGNDPPDVEEPIATATIGSGGGTIDAEGIVVSIPAGAFTDEETISLFRSQESKPFGTDQITDEYRVEGLPAACADGFEVRFAHAGSAADSFHVALGQDAIVAATGDTMVVYDLLSAADSSGVLICDVPGWSTAEGLKGTRYDLEITYSLIGVSRHVRWTTEGGGLEPVKYGLAIPPGFLAADMMDLVDNAHLTLVNMGFRGSKASGKRGLQIRIESIGSEGARFVYRNRDQSSYIMLDREAMRGDKETIRIAAAQAVLRWILFTYTYDPHYPVMVGPNNQDYHWLHEAVVAWVGEKFAMIGEQATYVPPGFAGNEETPFDGIVAGTLHGSGDSGVSQKRHGQGMAPLIKYLAEHLIPTDGTLSPSHILARLGTTLGPPMHPVQALTGTFQPDGGLIRTWFPVFINRYCLGYYHGVNWQDFVEDEDVSGFADIDEERDTLATFRTTYPDVSARRYRINLQRDDFPENTTIEIKLKTDIPADDLKIYAYKIVGETMRQIATGNKSLEIPNVKALRDEFADIILLVVNSSYHAPEYVTVSSIDVEVRVQGTRELDFKNCSVFLQVEANYMDGSFGDSWTWTRTITGSAIGSFTGNRFSGALNPLDHGADALGGINVRMNSEGTVVEELVFAFDITIDGSTFTKEIRANNLPFIQITDWGTTQYGVEGWETIVLVDEASDWWITSEWSNGFDTFETNETSYIFVEFN